MNGFRRSLFVLSLLTFARVVSAHPVPFSYLDVQLQKTSTDVSLVVHIFDLAHDLQVTPADRLLDPAVVTERDAAMRAVGRRARRDARVGRNRDPT